MIPLTVLLFTLLQLKKESRCLIGVYPSWLLNVYGYPSLQVLTSSRTYYHCLVLVWRTPSRIWYQHCSRVYSFLRSYEGYTGKILLWFTQRKMVSENELLVIFKAILAVLHWKYVFNIIRNCYETFFLSILHCFKTNIEKFRFLIWIHAVSSRNSSWHISKKLQLKFFLSMGPMSYRNRIVT